MKSGQNDLQQVHGFSEPRGLFVIATSHLDTQWRWTFRDTVQRYLRQTMVENFALFEKFPAYRFSFEGAFRYMLMKQYFPEEYSTLRKYVAEGKWNICGSSIDAGDVITVSPESILRQALYGNGFFEKEFGKSSTDVFLPDCFGFSWALPSVAAHCGLKSFSTSKLEWGSAVGIPFPLGFWEGPDGNGIVAHLNPGQYSLPLKDDPRSEDKWHKRLAENEEKYGVAADLKYFGLGDTGGAPDEESVRVLQTACDTPGEFCVVSAAAGDLARHLTDQQQQSLPRHRGELLLREHGVGTYTSNGAMKLLNHRNEFLADAAERAACCALAHAGMPYPSAVLKEAWIRILANQMHDILPGTSIGEAYRFSYNDELVSLNQFAGVLSDSVRAASAQFNTSVKIGTPIILFNPTDRDRTDPVLFLSHGNIRTVYTAEGSPVPTQFIPGRKLASFGLFKPLVPANGFAVYALGPRLRRFHDGTPTPSVGKQFLENEFLRAEFDQDGNLSSLVEKASQRESLSGPVRLVLLPHTPKEWPAWTLMHEDVSSPPTPFLETRPEFHIEETGPIRAALRMTWTRESGQVCEAHYRLASGSRALEVELRVLWDVRGSILKVEFPLAFACEKATYDLGLGVVERGINTYSLYEVPAQNWVDCAAPTGDFGVSVYTQAKYGWDRPNEKMLRLTLLHTPAMTGFTCHLGGANFTDDFSDQATLDHGSHVIRFAIRPHVGTWCDAGIVHEAAAFSQPLLAYETSSHPGAESTPSFLRLSSGAVSIMALKKCEHSEEFVVRLRETAGKCHDDIEVSFSQHLQGVSEITGYETEITKLEHTQDSFRINMKPFAIRSFRIALNCIETSSQPSFASVNLPFTLRGISQRENRTSGDFAGNGEACSLASELLPELLKVGNVPFTLGPRTQGEDNVFVSCGQSVELPAGQWQALHLLGAGIGKRSFIRFLINGEEFKIRFPDWEGFHGSWTKNDGSGTDLTTWRTGARHSQFIKTPPIAWIGTYRHSPLAVEKEAFKWTYLFARRIILPPGARRIDFGDWNSVRILAATVAINEAPDVTLITPGDMVHEPRFTSYIPPRH